jgi:cell division protein FtsI/penicillin-binding protein 2
MLGRTDSRARTLVVLLVFVLAAGSIGLRLGYWQVTRRDELAAMAAHQSAATYTVQPSRGSIYDRSGTVTLATTVPRDQLAADPSTLTPARRKEVAAHLVAMLQLKGERAAQLTSLMTSDRHYVVLAKDLTAAQSTEIRTLSGGSSPELAGLRLEPQPVREYPQVGGAPGTTLASHLLGFVNLAGAGQYGIEQYYQDQLAGQPTTWTAEQDSLGNTVPDTARVVRQGSPGQDLTLTIDASLQVAVEQEILSAWIADRAKSVSALVMDPYTGEIYAYASYPSYDANAYQTIANRNPLVFTDPIASSVYEPGSVFKMFTAQTALTEGIVTLDTKVGDAVKLSLDGGTSIVQNADHKALKNLTFADAIAFSRNVVASMTALRLGRTATAAATKLYATWTAMGLGHRTGLDVAGEASGIIRDPAATTYRQIDVANGSFGQGVAVTPIQLAQAFSAMVNGGTLVQPRLVRTIGNVETPGVNHGRVMTPAVSDQLQSLMRHVVNTVPFYRSRTLIPGFEVGGKTGTAQIWDAKTKDWKPLEYNYSFVGYIARTPGHPDLVVAVRIEEGTLTVARQGDLEMPVMSFELFRRIAHDAISTPNLIPEDRVLPPPAEVAP